MAKIPRPRLPKLKLPALPAEVKNIRDWQSLLTAAVTLPEPLVERTLRAAIARNPHATPDEIIADLNKRYQRRVSLESSSVGIGAAYPGIGTGIATGLSVAEMTTFLSESTLYILTVSRLYGIEVNDAERRKTLLLSSIFGADANQIMSAQLGLTGLAWARSALLSLRSEQVKQVNRFLMRKLSKHLVKKQTSSYIGRLLPFGVGAAIGWYSGRQLAQDVIHGLSVSLGQPPAQLPAQLVTIDIAPQEEEIIPAFSRNEE